MRLVFERQVGRIATSRIRYILYYDTINSALSFCGQQRNMSISRRCGTEAPVPRYALPNCPIYNHVSSAEFNRPEVIECNRGKPLSQAGSDWGLGREERDAI